MKVEFGIPNPTRRTKDGVSFKRLTSKIYFHEFPSAILPSGGLSGRISPSEMMMVRCDEKVRFDWYNEEEKEISDDKRISNYSFVGKYGWEVSGRGFYTCKLSDKEYNDLGKVIFEVL